MGSREDDDYWSVKYSVNPECTECGESMGWDDDMEDYYCLECDEQDG